MREPVAGEGDDVPGLRVHSGFSDDDGLDRLAPSIVGHADDGDIRDGGMVEQRVLDLGGVHVLAARDDHVLHPVGEEEIAVLIEKARVTRPEPSVGVERPGRLLRLAPVALEVLHRARPDLSHRPSRTVLSAPRLDDPNLHPGEGLAGRAEQARAGSFGLMVRGGKLGDGARRLREPVDLDEGTPECLHGADEHLVRDRGGAVDDGAERGIIPVGGARDHGEELEHGGHEERVGDAMPLQGGEDLLRHELADEDGVTTPAHADERPARAADVEERHAHEVHGGLVEVPEGPDVGQEGAQARVGEHGALGQARGARRVELHGDVVGRGGPSGIVGGMACQPRLVGFVARVGAEHDDLLDALEAAFHLLEVSEKVGTHEEDLGLGVIDDIGHLGGRQPPVHGHVDDIGLAAPEEHLEVLGAVLVQEGDPALLGEPGGEEPLRHAARSRVHLRPRDHALAVGDHRPVAPPARMFPDDSTQRPGHRTPPREPRVCGAARI